MRKKQFIGIVLAAGMLFATGCGGKTEIAEPGQSEQEVSGTEEDNGEAKEIEEAGENPAEEGDENIFSKGNTYSWEEITISIPDYWEGKYQIEQNENGFSLIQTASYEKLEGMGFLFGFYRTDRVVLEEPAATLLAYTDTQTYYMSEPTDVNYYFEDKQISEEYQKMYEYIWAVSETLEIDKEGVRYNPDEYILPLSSTVLLKEEDSLLNFSDNELSIARNEIYARHGRQFDSDYLQKYFDSCSWYEGTIPAKEFDESVLSRIEKDNLQIIKEAEKAYEAEHPYPKEYAIGSSVIEDLDNLHGDGKPEEIQYYINESEEQGKYNSFLTINGQEYWLEDYGIHLEEPVRDVFYVVNLFDQWSGEEPEELAIAVLDNGSAENPVTHFLSYNGKLSYIGSVQGFPFKQKSGFNGFGLYGTITGIVPLEFPHTCYGYGQWSYDLESRKLEKQEFGWYRFFPEVAHELYEDLTVYTDMNESGMKTVIPAQKKVFFMEVWTEDGKDGWVLLKGKDGNKGYIHVVDGKIAGNEERGVPSVELKEVFSGL